MTECEKLVEIGSMSRNILPMEEKLKKAFPGMTITDYEFFLAIDICDVVASYGTQTADSICQMLDCDPKKLNSVLKILVSTELLVKDGKEYSVFEDSAN